MMAQDFPRKAIFSAILIWKILAGSQITMRMSWKRSVIWPTSFKLNYEKTPFHYPDPDRFLSCRMHTADQRRCRNSRHKGRCDYVYRTKQRIQNAKTWPWDLDFERRSLPEQRLSRFEVWLSAHRYSPLLWE